VPQSSLPPPAPVMSRLISLPGRRTSPASSLRLFSLSCAAPVWSAVSAGLMAVSGWPGLRGRSRWLTSSGPSTARWWESGASARRISATSVPLGDCLPVRQPGRSFTTLWPGRPIEGPLPDSAKYRLALQLGEREAVRHFPQQLGQRRAERAADRCQQLRGRFLLTALNLGQISQRDACSGRHLAEGATLPETQPPQRVTEQVTKQHHRRTPFEAS